MEERVRTPNPRRANAKSPDNLCIMDRTPTPLMVLPLDPIFNIKEAMKEAEA